VVVVELYKEVFVGVKVAVIVEDPTPARVTVLPETVATDVLDEEYETDPAIVEPETVAVGSLIENAESPKFFEIFEIVDRLGVVLIAARTKNGVIFDHVTLLFVTVFNAVESVTKPSAFTAFNRSFESPTLVVGVLLTVKSLV
jgi:hypothetical protein